MQAIKHYDGYIFDYADDSLKQDRDIVLELVKQHGYALGYAHESLRKDRDIVMEAVKSNGYALNYAHDSFKSDKEIVTRAVEQDVQALEYVSSDLFDGYWNCTNDFISGAVSLNDWDGLHKIRMSEVYHDGDYMVSNIQEEQFSTAY